MKQMLKSVVGIFFLGLLLGIAFVIFGFFFVASAFNLNPIEAVELLRKTI